jgi:hypothetical protein
MAYEGQVQDYRPHVTYLARQREALRERLNKFTRDRHRHVKAAVSVVEVAAGAAIGGVIAGRAGEGGAHILRMPASLVLGGALIAGGVFASTGAGGAFAAASDHMVQLGTGFIAEFAGNWGYGVGQRWTRDGHLFGHGGGGGGGSLPAGGTKSAGELTPHQMAELVRQVQQAG